MHLKTKHKKIKLSGWARFPKFNTRIFEPVSKDELIKYIKNKNVIFRGNGRAYGDCAINKNLTVKMKNFNKILFFNKKNGQLVVESGVMLSDIIYNFLPKGWFLYVSPGTKFVTVGGMVACDVHGKNHHSEGSFGKFIDWIDLIKPNGKLVRCSLKKNKKLFQMTVGGMGLTGVILNVAFKLRPVSTSWIKQKTFAAKNLKETFDFFEKNLKSTYSVAWIDCLSKNKKLGRSLVMLGEHARPKDLKKKIEKFYIIRKNFFFFPVSFFSFFLNQFTIRIFNFLYFLNGLKNIGFKIINWDNYFYPLDRIENWNKIYGEKGFAQHQVAVPLENSYQAIKEILQLTSKSDCGPYLGVLKRLGDQKSLFSFPMKGYTLTLDFPISNKTLSLMKKLDNIVIKYNGRFYLAKESRLSREVFLKTEKRLTKFKNNLKILNQNNKNFCSEQSKRLGI